MKPSIYSKEYKNAISVEEMQKSDKFTIDNYVSSQTLMFRAAYGVYKQFNWNDKKIAIISGSGNNGGDGYALANILVSKGIYPVIFRTSEKFSKDGLHYYNKAKQNGVEDYFFDDNTELVDFDVIVDCILGTGFKGTPRGIAKKAIEKINQTTAYIISVDINSGLNGDTGEADIAVKSNLTVSIGYYKIGMFLNRAPDLIDDLINVDIGIILYSE